MAPIILQLVFDAQEKLRTANVLSVVTGDIGLSYHGIDIVTHENNHTYQKKDIELCVPAVQRELAIKTLQAQPTLYEPLRDLMDPDFYHPYKKGAARFKLHDVDELFQLHIITEDMLGTQLSSETSESGLTISEMHPELLDLSHDVSDKVLSAITWPTLVAFTDGWLKLADTDKLSEISLIYLMQAERLIDANGVDDTWCETSFKRAPLVIQAQSILRGKHNRLMQSNWD